MEKDRIEKAYRYFDLKGTTYVVVYSRKDVIKLMPIKKNSIIEVWEKSEFIQRIKTLNFIYISQPPINRINVSEHLLEYQFNIIGKTMVNTVTEPNWKNEWEMNEKQKEMFKSYSLRLLKKIFRFNTSKARETYEFFENNFGLQKVY
jgi:hypothetical protein